MSATAALCDRFKKKIEKLIPLPKILPVARLERTKTTRGATVKYGRLALMMMQWEHNPFNAYMYPPVRQKRRSFYPGGIVNKDPIL